MNPVTSRTAIVTRTSHLKTYPESIEVKTQLLEGSLVQLFNGHTVTKSKIKIYDFYNEYPELIHPYYFIPIRNLQPFADEELPQFVMPIKCHNERLRFAKDKTRINFTRGLKVGEFVSANGMAFDGNWTYDCIIRYCGIVPDFGPGYYFILEILDLNYGYSPQAEEIAPYLEKYFKCDSKLCLILSANWIHPIKHDQKPANKFSTKELFSQIVCGITDIIKPQSQEVPTYENIPTPIRKDNANIEMENNVRRSILTNSNSSSNVKKPEIDLIENDEFCENIEKYEKRIERKNDRDIPENRPPSKPKKKSPVDVRTSTILRLDDRDLIVIDKTDIKESIKNESEVIVLDSHNKPHKELELMDILSGSNWPTNAGGAGWILGNEKKVSTHPASSLSSTSSSSSSNNFIRSDRIKSANPVSHFGTLKTDRRSRGDGQTELYSKKKINEPVYDNTNFPALPELTNVSQEIEEAPIKPSPLSEIPGTQLGIGSVVEVSTDVIDTNLYGVIRWIGCTQENNSKSLMIGVELEDDPENKLLTLTDGINNGIRLFKCHARRAIFVSPNQCTKDRRFQEEAGPSHRTPAKVQETKTFGSMECPVVHGSVAPLKILNVEDLEQICGKNRGIQGHHNSCYLDATLFSMFTFTGVFDSLLFRPADHDDLPQYEEIQTVLREEIVNPLRKNMFVRADRVLKLRHLMDRLSSVTGLTTEEKDPEEFLNCLLAQMLRAEPFLKLSSGQDAFYYQLFVEKDERVNFPTVQQLFDQSFLASDIKLKEVPSCLIIQMPRFGKNYKMYPRILPSQVLDVTDIIEDSPRQCTVCGKLAEFECKECFGMMQCAVGLESTAFCKKCLETAHCHVKRVNHKPREISVPNDFKIMAEHCQVPRLYMELFAVVCIETSHYVSFVKSGSGQDSPWCFFDSMADRKGEQNGYNIPEMVSVPDLPHWLSDEGARLLNEQWTNDKFLPEYAKRLFCDAYMCMYQSTDVMMYR